MLTPRPASARGRFDHGWLDTAHTFSFGHYHDPAHMGFGPLRVINEDRVAPGQGFGEHGHRDMEILSYVLSGALHHADSLGSSGVIRPGELQRMSAGRGVRHSEKNASATEPVHFLQIWIIPDRPGHEPGYQQIRLDEPARRDRLALAVSHDGRNGSVRIHQDAELWTAVLTPGASVTHPLRPGRRGWVQVARGRITVNGHAMSAGDGVAASDERELVVRAEDDAEILLFDLA